MYLPSAHKLGLTLKILSLSIFLISSQTYISLGQVKQADPFLLAGQLPHPHKGHVYLLDQDAKRVYSSRIEANRFTLTGKIAEPTLYYLQIDTMARKYPVFLDGSPMQVVIHSNGTYQVEGSKTHTQWKQYTSHTDQIRQQLISLYQQRSEAKQKGDTTLFNQLMKQNYSVSIHYGTYLRERISQRPYSYFNLFLLKNDQTEEAYMLNMLNEFRPQLAHYPTFQALDEELKRRAKLRQTIAVGQQAYDFSLPDSSGMTYDLKALRKNNKLILLDFWASWCGPCLKELPALKALYQEYAHQGLIIIGISIDSDGMQWRKTLSTHGPAGLQLLSGNKSLLIDKYAITGVPQTFLIDQDGTIQAHSLRGNNLRQKVADLLSKAR